MATIVFIVVYFVAFFCFHFFWFLTKICLLKIIKVAADAKTISITSQVSCASIFFVLCSKCFFDGIVEMINK